MVVIPLILRSDIGGISGGIASNAESQIFITKGKNAIFRVT
jgi:hypothetical protein